MSIPNDAAEVDDASLLRRAAGGDAAAFAVFYDRIAPMVLLRLRRRCSDAETVADVLQETFTSAWRAAATWDGRGDPAAWVWTIAARRLVDAFRRHAAQGRSADLRASLDGTDRAPSAEQQVMDGLLAGPLESALVGLSPELRAVLQATVLDGLTTREAALVLGIPEGTVKTRAFRARAVLREALA